MSIGWSWDLNVTDEFGSSEVKMFSHAVGLVELWPKLVMAG
jgi:hypothetical protein